MPGRNCQAAAALLDEDFRRAPRRHQHVVADQEAGAGPVVLGMAEQFDAADAALGHLDVLALIFQHVPQRRRAGERAVVHQHGRPAVQQQHALQPQRLFRREVVARAARRLLQAAVPASSSSPMASRCWPRSGSPALRPNSLSHRRRSVRPWWCAPR